MRLIFVGGCHDKRILMLSLLIPSLSRDEQDGRSCNLIEETAQRFGYARKPGSTDQPAQCRPGGSRLSGLSQDEVDYVGRCHEKRILMLSLLIPSLSRDEARRMVMQFDRKVASRFGY